MLPHYPPTLWNLLQLYEIYFSLLLTRNNRIQNVWHAFPLCICLSRCHLLRKDFSFNKHYLFPLIPAPITYEPSLSSQNDLLLDLKIYIPSIIAPIIENPQPPFDLRRTSRQIKWPSYLATTTTYYKKSTFLKIIKHAPSPFSNVILYLSLWPIHPTFSATTNLNLAPSEAVKYQCLRDAMTSKITALQDDNTWEITKLPPN